MRVVENQPQTKEDDDTIFKKDSQKKQPTGPRVIHSVKRDMRTLRNFNCDESLFTNFHYFVNMYQQSRYPKAPRDVRTFCCKRLENPFFGEKEDSLSDFRHASLANPAILCPAVLTFIFLHTYFRLSCMSFFPNRWRKRSTQHNHLPSRKKLRTSAPQEAQTTPKRMANRWFHKTWTRHIW